MPSFGKLAALPMLVLAATAGAQSPAAAACDVNEDNPGSLALAMLSLTAAQNAATPAEIGKNLSNAISRLFDGDQAKQVADNAKNPAGRAFIVGKIYMVWLTIPEQPVITTRGKLGFKSNPDGVADLAKGIDSAFKVVEEKAPQCGPFLNEWRRQGGWVKLVTQAMDYVNAGKTDSAEVVANQAMTISSTAPYSHLVLGNVAAAREKVMDAIKRYKDAVAEADKDTIFNSVRRQILYTLGNYALQASEADTNKANQTTLRKEALAATNELAKDPGKEYVDAARQMKTAVLQALGDTAAIRAACQEQVDAPDKFNFLTLVQCGAILAQIGDNVPALKLFEAAHTQNPYHQDGLRNLALMQLNKQFKKYDEALKTIDQLNSLDPSNPENVRLYFYAWGSIREQLRALSDSIGKQTNALARTPATEKQRKALTDSAIKIGALTQEALNKAVDYNTKADSMPVKVTFTEFTPGTEKTTISGMIRNRSGTQKTYVMDVEFLDKTGAVIVKASATVPDVPPGGAKDFSMEGKGANIVAFRYKPLDK